MVIGEVKGLKTEISSLNSVIDRKDKEITKRNNIIQQKDKLLQEKEVIINRMRKMTMTEEPLQEPIEDEADFTFDDLLQRSNPHKRMTEIPNIKEKVIQEPIKNVIYREDEYIIPENLQSQDEENASADIFLSPPTLNRRGSTFNKLKTIAEDPKRLKEITQGVSDRKLSMAKEGSSGNIPDLSLGSPALQREPEGPIFASLKKSKKNVIIEAEEK